MSEIKVVPCQICGAELTNLSWTGWGCDKCNCPRCPCHGLSRSYGKECNQPAAAAIEQARPQPRGGFVSGQIFEVRATDNEHELLIAANSTQEALLYAEFIDPKREYKTAETFVGRQVWMKR